MPTTFGADANNNKIKVNVRERIEKYSKWWREIKDFSGSKGPLWHTKTKATAELLLWEEGLQWDKIGEESKSIPKAGARDKPHGEEKEKKKKKKRNQKPKERRNKKLRKKKKEMDFIVNVNNVSVKVRVISFNEKG